jgi:hypothetical protein
MVNEKLNKNFWDFINDSGIDEAKQLLMAGDRDCSIIEVA